jgi:putative intracellular protease/amidase
MPNSAIQKKEKSPNIKLFINTNIFWLIAISTVVIVLLVVALPTLLNMLGLNRRYRGRSFSLPGKRALIIATNHDILGETGKKTGVYASEMTVPYYEFLDGNMNVDVASIQGGEIPIEPSSIRWPLLTPSDKRFLKDSILQDKVKYSQKITDLDFTKYDIVYMAGGWGAAYDLGYSEVLGQKISEAYAGNVVLGSVCHGALGFLQAKDQNGNPLVKGRRMTAVTDKQVKELRIIMTPQHPERELRKAGALFENKTAFRDFFASHVVVDGNIVTGQNQNDAAETAQLMMGIVENRSIK